MKTTVETRELHERFEREVEEETKLDIATRSTPTGQNLLVGLTVSDTCTTTRHYDLERIEVRRGHPEYVAAAAITGAILIPVSVALALVARRASTEKAVDEMGEEAIMSPRAAVKLYSAMFGFGGAAALLGAGVAKVQAKERRRPIGTLRRNDQPQRAACNPRPYEDARVAVGVQHQPYRVQGGRADSRGQLRLGVTKFKKYAIKADPQLPLTWTISVADFEDRALVLPGMFGRQVADVRRGQKQVRADELAVTAEEALDSKAYGRAETVATECVALVGGHAHCQQIQTDAAGMLRCNGLATTDDANIFAVWKALEEMKGDASKLVGRCVTRVTQKLRPRYKRELAAVERAERLAEAEDAAEMAQLEFDEDVEGTHDAIWNYILARFVVKQAISYQMQYEVELIIDRFPRDVCPIWKGAIKEHGKKHLRPAIDEYCEDGTFPHEICNSYTGTCRTMTIGYCKRTFKDMCGW